jgi:CheY-like chemotaxis protein
LKPGDTAPWSSVRVVQAPPIPRRVWIFGPNPARVQAAIDALTKAGHEAKAGETGVELAPSLRDYRPDLIVIDMQDAPERGRHLGIQMRADRATRQLPIVLTGIQGEEGHKAERAIQGPTRRYALPLDAPSVLGALIVEL